jgi:glutamine amidotransferase
MQILMQTSEEGSAAGLGWIGGEVAKFRQGTDAQRMRVPHMGWNTVQPHASTGLLAGIDEHSRFYFLHSYFVRCAHPGDVLAQTTYGEAFAAALGRDNIYGVQFHPEKSHGDGIRLLRNFAEL